MPRAPILQLLVRFRLPRTLLLALALAATLDGVAAAAPPAIGERELVALGFKPLVAATPVQEKWVQGLPAGQLKAMQRNGRKFYLYPDHAHKQVFVGGPDQYAAFRSAYPEHANAKQDAAKKSAEYRAKQDAVMRNATARDLSDPFLGVTWADLGW
jgi:hypothetical protein